MSKYYLDRFYIQSQLYALKVEMASHVSLLSRTDLLNATYPFIHECIAKCEVGIKEYEDELKEIENENNTK